LSSRLLLPAILITALAACAPAPAAAPSSPARGGTVILALSQEPDTLNPYLASIRAAGEVHTFIIEGLLSVGEKGQFYPALATEVPTQRNGGVSADGLTITYHLRENVTWSDGQAFTCDDVRFTWQAVVAPKNGAVGTAGYDQIQTVDCPDPTTAVVRYKSLYAAYLVPFWAILPKHATGDPAAMTQWQYNRNPIGTGPFKIAEWVSGDHITLVANEHYREQGKPTLESVIIRFVPSRDVALQLLRSGQVTIVGDLAESDLPQLKNAPGISTGEAPGPRSERLLLNLADPSLDAPADPLDHPHPILGDARVRQALELAIDKKQIVDKLLYGQASAGTNELNIGWAECETPTSAFDPSQARQLLDQAGWKVGGDGIRTAQGAKFAKDGTRLRLKLQGPSGDPLREQVEQFILDEWKAVGVEGYIENAPTAVLFGTWDANAVARHGKFDILIYTTGPYVDPQSQVETYFASWQIPTVANRGAGYNYSRWIDPAADDAIKQAGSTTDLAARRNAYCKLMDQVTQERPEIYLFARHLIAAYSDRLQGWSTNVWKNLGWNAAGWRLKP
jgi:peptide/nickel transport system substrate-binding protein